MDEFTANFLKDVVFSVFLLFVVYRIGVQFLNIWRKQIESRDNAFWELLSQNERRDMADDELKKGQAITNHQLTTLADKMAAAFQTMETAFQSTQANHQLALQGVADTHQKVLEETVSLRAEIQTMGEDQKKEAEATQETLQSLIDQLAVLNQRLEPIDDLVKLLKQARLETFATVPESIERLLREIQSAVIRIQPDTPDSAHEEVQS